MASNFPAYVCINEDASLVREYTPGTAAGEQMKVGEIVQWDDANNWVERAGADPTPILGICEVDSEQARLLTASGKIPIRILNPNTIVCMASATTPVVATHVGQKYGIVRDGTTGFWLVDVSDTVNTRVIVDDVDITSGAEKWYVRFLQANLLYAGS